MGAVIRARPPGMRRVAIVTVHIRAVPRSNGTRLTSIPRALLVDRINHARKGLAALGAHVWALEGRGGRCAIREVRKKQMSEGSERRREC